MAGLSCGTTVPHPDQQLLPEEKQRMDQRRADVQSYEPPKWTSTQVDPVSGEVMEFSKVKRASILATDELLVQYIAICIYMYIYAGHTYKYACIVMCTHIYTLIAHR